MFGFYTRVLLLAAVICLMGSAASGQTPTVVPGVSGPPATTTTTPPATKTTTTTAPPATTTTTTTPGLLKLEGSVEKLEKQFKLCKMDKWLLHNDYSVGFLIPIDRVNIDYWKDLTKKVGFKDTELKMADATFIGVYSYDGKTFASATVVTGKKGTDRKVFRMSLTGLTGRSVDEAIVQMFLESDHGIIEEAGKDSATGKGGTTK